MGSTARRRSRPLGAPEAPLLDVSGRTVQRWIKARAAELIDSTGDDASRDLSAHDARRTWATLLAGAEGVDPLLVCQWGGWSELETFLDHYPEKPSRPVAQEFFQSPIARMRA